LPAAVPAGPLIHSGFEGAPLFPVDFTVAADAAIGSVIEVEAAVYYLVCKDICIPENGTLRLILQVAAESELNDRNAAAIAEAINMAPRALAIPAAMQANGEALSLQFADLPAGDFSNAYFFPYVNTLVVHSDPQKVSQGEGGIQIDTTASFGWGEGFSEPQQGVLAFEINGTQTGRIVTVASGPALSVGVENMSPLTPAPSITLWGAIFGAFVGGLILHFLPCVFPVISLTALSLAMSAPCERTTAEA